MNFVVPSQDESAFPPKREEVKLWDKPQMIRGQQGGKDNIEGGVVQTEGLATLSGETSIWW